MTALRHFLVLAIVVTVFAVPAGAFACTLYGSPVNCDSMDGYVTTGSYLCCDGDRRCDCTEQDYRDYTQCAPDGCTVSTTGSRVIEDNCNGCGSSSCGGWSGCQYDDRCDEDSSESRDCTDRGCSSGSCFENDFTETRDCSRDTEGMTTMCYSGAMGTDGVGPCVGGTSTCMNGTAGACDGEVTPATETCNGVDDDCNGMVDDMVTDCAAGEFCWSGACFVSCTDNSDCGTDESCYPDPSRCAADACAGVECSDGESCVGGSCFPSCTGDADCPEGDACFDDRCAADRCDGIQCPAGQLCFEGSCFVTCTSDTDCEGQGVCEDSRCADSGTDPDDGDDPDGDDGDDDGDDGDDGGVDTGSPEGCGCAAASPADSAAGALLVLLGLLLLRRRRSV